MSEGFLLDVNHPPGNHLHHPSSAGSKTTTEKITSYKSDLIKTSLCALNDKDLQGEAVQVGLFVPENKDWLEMLMTFGAVVVESNFLQCFRNVTGYMGDRKSNKSNMDHCYKLLNTMLQSMEDLRNEVIFVRIFPRKR